MRKNSTFITVIIALVGLGMIITYSSLFSGGNRAQAPTENNVAGVENSQTAPVSFSYQGQAGKTALDLLKEKYPVETQSSDFGELVTSINGQAADASHFWSFIVNGELATEGAGTYQTKDADQIIWELTKIQ